MVKLEALISRFGQQGEKTGWTYILLPEDKAGLICPGRKTSFRVKGTIDQVLISQTAVMPMGNGDFILPLNAAVRKQLKKTKGMKVKVALEWDPSQPALSQELLTCLADEPEAMKKFQSLPPGHQRYFSKWVEDAKTEMTRAKRIAHCLHFLSLGYSYSEMIRALKASKERE